MPRPEAVPAEKKAKGEKLTRPIPPEQLAETIARRAKALKDSPADAAKLPVIQAGIVNIIGILGISGADVYDALVKALTGGDSIADLSPGMAAAMLAWLGLDADNEPSDMAVTEVEVFWHTFGHALMEITTGDQPDLF